MTTGTISGGCRWSFSTAARRTGCIPEEYQIGTCTLRGSVIGRYGPGSAYAAIGRSLPSYAACKVFAYADGGNGDYVQIECYDSGLGQYRRAWVPVSSVSGLTLY